MFRVFIISFFLLTLTQGVAQRRSSNFNVVSNKFKVKKNIFINPSGEVKHKRGVAAILDLTLGVFGVHRMYLGTKPKVPAVYTITLGGGGFLVLTDLGIILFTKDLEKYHDKGTVLMWSE